MPPIDNEIRREDLAYRVAKALEIKGQMPLLSLDPAVVPCIIVEDLSGGNEQDYAVNRWCRGRGDTPAGAQFGKLSFNNYVDSGILVRIYQIDVFGDKAAAAGIEVGISIESASAGGTQINNTKMFIDSRLAFGNAGIAQPARLPSVDIRFDNSAGFGVHPLRPLVPAPAVGHFHVNMGGWVLKPGTRLHFEGLDLGIAYSAHVEWTETNI